MSEQSRPYVCRTCDTIVHARWGGAGTFDVGCDCTTVPIVPQLGQADTPDTWRVLRPECCRDVEIRDLETQYRNHRRHFQCPDCKAVYDWHGAMVEEPVADDTARDDDQQTLVTDGGVEQDSGHVHQSPSAKALNHSQSDGTDADCRIGTQGRGGSVRGTLLSPLYHSTLANAGNINQYHCHVVDIRFCTVDTNSDQVGDSE